MIISDTLDRHGFDEDPSIWHELMIQGYVSIYEDEQAEFPIGSVRILSVYQTKEGALTSTITPVYTRVLMIETLSNPDIHSDVIKVFHRLNLKGYIGLTGVDGDTLPVPCATHTRLFSSNPVATMPVPLGHMNTLLYLYSKELQVRPITRAVTSWLKQLYKN